MITNPLQKGFVQRSPEERREQTIKELEHRIAHHNKYRRALIEEALELSSSNERKAWLLERARQFAVSISNIETRLYELYAERAWQEKAMTCWNSNGLEEREAYEPCSTCGCT